MKPRTNHMSPASTAPTAATGRVRTCVGTVSARPHPPMMLSWISPTSPMPRNLAEQELAGSDRRKQDLDNAARLLGDHPLPDISNYSLRRVTLYAFTGSWNPLSWSGPTGSTPTRSVTVA